MNLQNFVENHWNEIKGEQKSLYNSINGELVAKVGSDEINYKAALEFGRQKGSKALRELSFHERGRMLKNLALHLLSKKEKFYKISAATGATKMDSWIDIEGGIGNLFTYASKGRRELPDLPYFVDGKLEKLSKEGTFVGHHICVPKEGIALHINAFNFPVWGMLEKIAVNLLAGMAAIVKPARNTSYLTESVFKEIIDSKIFPEGALQLICGSVHGIFDHLMSQDVVTFTGSATTGRKLKVHPRIIQESIPFNMEADSLNCSILGLSDGPGSPEFDIFIKEVSREMTVKAGQKCTAIRRIFVPEKYVEDVNKALLERLSKVVIGDPSIEGVRMGPLAFRDHLTEVRDRVAELKKYCSVLTGEEGLDLKGGNEKLGAFMRPTLLLGENPLKNKMIHEIEAFGPVATVMPYKNKDEVIELAKMGEGSLVGSIVSFDRDFVKDIVLGVGSYHGRLVLLDRESAKESTGHGSPLPQLVHGGPGRAGGGEEMGGLRGVFHYMQRVAIQGHPTTLSKVTGSYQMGGKQVTDVLHPFSKYFEELSIGETLTTHKRTITETDIVNFSNISWDHFYAHTDVTSLEGTIFEQRVAHGYFIMSMAAGLFVYPNKGPVLANYGLEELRFVKPVYAGSTLGVRLTVKEKIDQEAKEGEKPRGVVKWLVDTYDETGETVAIGTILTLVQKKCE